MEDSAKKALIIRFSSFGDICQSLFTADAVAAKYSKIEIHYLTRSDFAEFLESVQSVDKVWSLDKTTGIWGLIKLAFQLRNEKFDIIYDAHNNTRSWLTSFVLRAFRSTDFYRRPKNRFKRMMLFKYRKNYFPNPFRGAASYLEPLKLEFLSSEGKLKNLTRPKFRFSNSQYIALAPHATWGLKEAPIDFWRAYIRQNPGKKFVALGGPDDTLPKDLQAAFPEQVEDVSGQLSWKDSSAIIAGAKEVIGVDTGLTHLADYLGISSWFLIGPSAFGYPIRQSSRVLEIEISCKPCSKDGRGKCVNPLYKKCMIQLNPARISLKGDTSK